MSKLLRYLRKIFRCTAVVTAISIVVYLLGVFLFWTPVVTDHFIIALRIGVGLGLFISLIIVLDEEYMIF